MGKEKLDLSSQPWGILVERFQIQDVTIPEPLQWSLASKAKALETIKCILQFETC